MGNWFDSLSFRMIDTGVIKNIITVAIRLIDMTKNMHEMGVIHGDIHEGNVVFGDRNDSIAEYVIVQDDISYIDFGMGELFPLRLGDPEMGKPIELSLNPLLLSPWQLQGYRLGERAKELFSCLTRREREERVREFQINQLIIEKRKNIFEGHLGHLDSQVQREGETHLGRFLEKILAISHPHRRSDRRFAGYTGLSLMHFL